VPRLVTLPSEGSLLLATDLQGNVEDFLALEAIFEEEAARPKGAVLVVTGDLVHGPELSRGDWPGHLGSFYRGDSVALLELAEALGKRHPGRVHYLLGNHEHAHIGGPVVSKFFPDEAARLEHLLGPERSERLRDWLLDWPLVAVAKHAGIAMTHGAPHAVLESADDIETLPLGPVQGAVDLDGRSLLALLWARTTSSERAHAFLRQLDPALRVAVYGHDVAPAGYAIDREPLLCISTSFGCHDGDKLYLSWDLSKPATSAAHVAREGLRPLYPDASPVMRRPSA
jgi:hypothetical protein